MFTSCKLENLFCAFDEADKQYYCLQNNMYFSVWGGKAEKYYFLQTMMWTSYTVSEFDVRPVALIFFENN